MRVTVSPSSSVLGDPEVIKSTGLTMYKHLTFSTDGRTLAYSAVSARSNIWAVRVSPGQADALGSPDALAGSLTNTQRRPGIFI